MDYDDDDTVDELPPRPRQAIPAADRELLALAARALGAVRVEDVDGEEWVNLHFADGTMVYGWNPLIHRDDTFELQVKLGLTVQSDREMRRSVAAWGDGERCTEPWPDETPDSSATARTVVRAAAEIGRAIG